DEVHAVINGSTSFATRASVSSRSNSGRKSGSRANSVSRSARSVSVAWPPITFMARSKKRWSFIELIANAGSFLSTIFLPNPNPSHCLQAALQINAHRADRYAALIGDLLVSQTVKKEI